MRVPAHDRPGRCRAALSAARAPHRADERQRSSRRVRVDQRFRAARVHDGVACVPGRARHGSTGSTCRRAYAGRFACRSPHARQRSGSASCPLSTPRRAARARSVLARAAGRREPDGGVLLEVLDEPAPRGGRQLLRLGRELAHERAGWIEYRSRRRLPRRHCHGLRRRCSRRQRNQDSHRAAERHAANSSGDRHKSYEPTSAVRILASVDARPGTPSLRFTRTRRRVYGSSTRASPWSVVVAPR